MKIKLNQMKILRRIFLDSFREDFRMKGLAPKPENLWNEWVLQLDSETSVRGVTREDLELTLLGKRPGNVRDGAAHGLQISIALDFFMSEKGESRRWDNLIKALYGVTVKDAIASLD